MHKGIIIYTLSVLSLALAGLFAMFALSPGFRWHAARHANNILHPAQTRTAAELDTRLREIDATIAQGKLDPGLHIERAETLAGLGRPDDAVAEMESAAEAHPDDARTHRYLSELLLRTGGTEAALVHAKRAVELDTGNPDGLRQLADTLLTLGLYAEAEKAYGNALVAYGDAPPFWDIEARTVRALVQYGRGRALNALGRFDEALKVCKEADKAVPNGGFSIDNRIYALAGKGEYGDAVLKFQGSLDDWDLRESASVYAYALKHRGGKGDDSRLSDTLKLIMENARDDQVLYASAVKGDKAKVMELAGRLVAEKPYMRRVIRARIEMQDMLADPDVAGVLSVDEG